MQHLPAAGAARRLACLGGLLGAALVGCDDAPPPAPTASAASATTSATTPSARRPSGLGRLFAGVPGRDSVGYQPAPIPGAGDLSVRIPPGWKRETVGKALQLREKDRRAVASLQAGFERVRREDVAGAANALGFEDVAWGEGVDGQLGAGRLPGTLSEGESKLGGEPARIWFVDVEVSGGTRLLVVAGGLHAADDAREVLIECLRSVRVGK